MPSTTRDLIDRYAAGQLDRRGFVAKLTALGVSAGAAAAYAVSFAPRAGAQLPDFRLSQTYGTAVEFESDEEAANTVATVDQAQSDLINTGLEQFTGEDFEQYDVNGLDTYEQLQEMATHVEEHLDALRQALESLSENPVAAAIQIPEIGSSDEFVEKLGNLTDLLARLYAAVVPAVESPELRQQLANAALVKGRHAAYLNLIRGLPPFEEAFETPATIDDLLEQIEAILNS